MLPKGISNYKELVDGQYYYIDKTMYIEKLERLADKRLIFLRPKRFGKTLFTSILENYYDVDKKDKFEELFGETYIGKNPTALRNSYYILYFNFSGVNTESREKVIESFHGEIKRGINKFVDKYNLKFSIDDYETIEILQKNFFDKFEL